MQMGLVTKAREMGLFVAAVDRDGGGPGFRHADVNFVAEPGDTEGLVEFARSVNEKHGVRGVLQCTDLPAEAALISDALGLKGLSRRSAELASNKAMMKKRLAQKRIPTPKAFEVSDAEEAKAAVGKTGLPCVIKPVAGTGPRRVDNLTGFDDAVGGAIAASATGTALVEEYIRGPEQSVELIVRNGVHYRFGVVDRHFSAGIHRVETGHTNPSTLPSYIQKELYSLAIDAASALGLEFGPYRVETMITGRGPMVVGLTTGLSAGFRSQFTTPYATGLDPATVAIALAADLPLPANFLMPRAKMYSVLRGVFPSHGCVKCVRGVNKARRLEGISDIIVALKAGDVIDPSARPAEKGCFILATGRTPAEAEEKWAEARETLEIRTDPLLGPGGADENTA